MRGQLVVWSLTSLSELEQSRDSLEKFTESGRVDVIDASGQLAALVGGSTSSGLFSLFMAVVV